MRPLCFNQTARKTTVALAMLMLLPSLAVTTAADSSLGCPGLQARRNGTTTWQVDGAEAFPTATQRQFVQFDPATPCDRLVLSVSVGAKFWNCSVWNEYSCDCAPPSTCEPPNVVSRPLRALHPFLLTFEDVSTSISRPINTRRNSPLDPSAGLWSSNLTVPYAVDRRQLTAAVRVSLRFLPQATTTFCTGLVVSPTAGLECFNLQHTATDPTYVGWLQQSFASPKPRMGLTLRRKAQQVSPLNPLQVWTVSRKPPFPSFNLVLSHECCGQAAPCAVHPYVSRVLQGRFKEPADVAPLTGPCCYVGSSGSSCQCFNFSASVTFYEAPRLYASTFSFGSGSPDPLSGQTREGDVVTVNATGDFPLRFRFVRYDIPPDPSLYPTPVPPLPLGLPTLWDNHTVYGLYVLQPFPLKDLWIQVVDGAGNVMFEEQEVRVPYRDPGAKGQLGWFFAVDSLPGRDEPGVRIVARYNRRAALGKTEEAVRSALLLQWLGDLSSTSSWSAVIAPIPTTISLDRGVLGMVSASSLNSGNLIAHVPYRAVLTSEIAQRWYNATLGYKCAARPATFARGNCSELLQNITASTEQNAVDLFYLAIFVVLQGVNLRDGTSSWFPLFDSFYPENPPHLVWFQDNHTLQRLYGFSEIPRMVEERLAAWQLEFDILSDAFPWFAHDVTEAHWASARAWVMASTYWNGTHVVLLPGVTLMRHGTVPNTNLVLDPATNDVKLVANRYIAASTELYPNVNPSQVPLHEYFLRYGQTPTASPLVATVPGLNTYLGSSDASRSSIVNELSALYGEDYKTSLGRFLSLIGVKLGTLPSAVDGLGSDPATVALASAILQAERVVLSQQFADGTGEYNSL